MSTQNFPFHIDNSLIIERTEGLLRTIKNDSAGHILEALEDLASAETNVRNEYYGRYLFELLQNADDAIREASQTGKVRYELTKTSLIVANSGRPFQEKDVESLCRHRQSKKTVGVQIGHKGIGFKSVLEITEKPQIFSGQFTFGFDKEQLERHLQEIPHAAEHQIPYLRFPFVRRLDDLPVDERSTIEQLFKSGFVTVIRLPVKSNQIYEQVNEDLRQKLTLQSLLFLEGVQELQIITQDYIRTFTREVLSSKFETHQYVKLVKNQPGQESSEWWMMLPRKSLSISDRSLTSELGETWQKIHVLHIQAAFPITPSGDFDNRLSSQPFYVYLPTEEPSGFSFLMNGDFYIQAARKEIGSLPINKWLIEKLAEYISVDGVNALKAQFTDYPEDVTRALVPASEPQRDLGRRFHNHFREIIKNKEFVAKSPNGFVAPQDIHLPPSHLDLSAFEQVFVHQANQSRWNIPHRNVLRNRATREFLFQFEGVSELSFMNVVDFLHHHPPEDQWNERQLLTLLANWWYSIKRWERPRDVLKTLAECPVVPTPHGWKSPKNTQIFEPSRTQEELILPDGFDVVFALNSLYQAPGNDNRKEQQDRLEEFIRELGVSRFRQSDIISRAIIPVLSDLAKIKHLSDEQREQAYQYLMEYQASGNKPPSDIKNVYLSAFRTRDSENRYWWRAGDLYFSAGWLDSDNLFLVLQHIVDTFFVAEPDEWCSPENPDEVNAWREFFLWLGVEDKLRIIESSEKWLATYQTEDHNFSSQSQWSHYLNEFEEVYWCPNTGSGTNPHGYTRCFNNNWRLDGFEAIIKTAPYEDSVRLFPLLAAHWDHYSQYLTVELSCKYTTTGCDSEEIPSYFGYCLKQTPWLPVERFGEITHEFKTANELRNLSEDVPITVQRLLPALPRKYRTSEYKHFRTSLLHREYQLQDYIELFTQFAELFPLYPSNLEESELQSWQRKVKQAFNWLCNALQNSLQRQGQKEWPEVPGNLKMLAFQRGSPTYVNIHNPIFYPDQRNLATHWEETLTYFEGDRNWRKLRDWLQIPTLSKEVHSELQPPSLLDRGNNFISSHYENALPYFLAYIRQEHPSHLERATQSLLQLRIVVAEELIISQTLPLLDIESKTISERAYLDKTNHQLFVAQEYVDNPYILGNLVSEYIGLSSLQDVFDTLYGATNESRLAYLESRGISKETVEWTRSYLAEVKSTPPIDDFMYPDIQQAEPATDEPATDEPNLPKRDGRDSFPIPSHKEYTQEENGHWVSNHEFSHAPSIFTEDIEYDPASSAKRKPRRSGSSRGATDTDRIGRKGEKIAFEWEKRRLTNLGLDPEQLIAEGKLRWVARQQRTANHDIQSVDNIDGKLQTIYIEVKATVKDELISRWSRSEFQLAEQKRDLYRIYGIVGVDNPSPHIVVYKNPYEMMTNGQLEYEMYDCLVYLA